MEENLNFLLYLSVKRNDPLETILELLDQGANPNYQSTFGKSPLHMAAKTQDDAEVIEALVTAGADVDLNNHLSYTALHYAVRYRNTDSVYLLVQYGACVNAKTFLGETPLHFAVKTFRNDDQGFLEPDLSIIKFLTEQNGININAKDFFGNTPLMVAVQEVQEEIVELLLDYHADPNIPNNDSESPLHAAFWMPADEIQYLLLKKGAFIYCLDKNGQTPLEIFFENYSGITMDEPDIPIFILEYLALNYRITSDLKQKLSPNSELSQYFNHCCDKVDRMRYDFIFGKITMHDFLCGCVNENDFESPLQEIYFPVVERLVLDVYPEFLNYTLDIMPDSSLNSILQMTACLEKCVKFNRELKLFADVISLSHVTLLISVHLSKYDIFSLIVAFSDVVNPQSF